MDIRTFAFGLLAAALLLSPAPLLGKGSPKAFAPFAGDYSGSGNYTEMLGGALLQNGTLTTAAARLSVQSPPRSATFDITSQLAFSNGTSTQVIWKLTFSRRNQMTESLRFVSGRTGTMATSYSIKRGRVTYSGGMVFAGQPNVLGNVVATLRFTATQVRITETITLSSGEVLRFRQTLRR
jgi:hypothetical protein